MNIDIITLHAHHLVIHTCIMLAQTSFNIRNSHSSLYVCDILSSTLVNYILTKLSLRVRYGTIKIRLITFLWET